MPARGLFSPEELGDAVRRMGAEVSADHPGGVVLVGVLKGSVVFLSDLARALTVPVEIDFIAISRFAPDSGRVRIVKDLDIDVTGRDVVLVEDIVDTGLSLTTLLGHLRGHGPRRVEVCTMLDRVHRRIVPVPVRYHGFPIDDEFVLGYGLDFAERYRNLEGIVAGDLRELRDDPDAHLAELYGSLSPG